MQHVVGEGEIPWGRWEQDGRPVEQAYLGMRAQEMSEVMMTPGCMRGLGICEGRGRRDVPMG